MIIAAKGMMFGGRLTIHEIELVAVLFYLFRAGRLA